MNEDSKITSAEAKNSLEKSRFSMTDEDDLEIEEAEAEHVHAPGCCSCHSNVGK